jgi:hypothetical protein
MNFKNQIEQSNRYIPNDRFVDSLREGVIGTANASDDDANARYRTKCITVGGEKVFFLPGVLAGKIEDWTRPDEYTKQVGKQRMKAVINVEGAGLENLVNLGSNLVFPGKPEIYVGLLQEESVILKTGKVPNLIL